jgi:ADP-ribose pyrophosphatase
MRRFEIEKVQRVYDGFFAVDEATVAFEKGDGTMSGPSSRLSVERGDAAAVIVFNRSRGKFLFVRQFRYPMVRHEEAWLLEAVAGKVDEGESPDQAAVREVMEEIGFQVKHLEALGAMYGSPGGMSECIYLFFAQVSDEDRTGQGGGIEDEDVDLVEIDGQEVWRMVDAYEIRDGKTLLGLHAARAKGLPSSNN